MMNRIRSRLAKLVSTFMSGTARFFPSFVYSLALALALVSLLEGSKLLPRHVSEHLCVTLVAALFASVPSCLAMEWRGISRRKALCVEWAITLLTGALFGALHFVCTDGSFSAYMRYFELALAGYLILCAVLSYVLLMEWSNEHTLFLSILAAFSYGIALPLMLMALLAVCLLAFQTLIHPLPDLINELITCLTMIPLPVCVFLALLPRRGENSKRFLRFESVDRLIISLLSAVYMGLLGILLLYVGKIVITRQMPVGEMNWYASFALLYDLLLWLMPTPRSKNAACRLYARFGGWLLLPVIAVQVYGIGVRFAAYGLTTLRYISMVCLALGVFALALTLLRRSLRPVFIATAAAVAVLTFTPLNAIDVPIMEQEARLQRLLAENDMLSGDSITPNDAIDKDTQARILSCVNYLKRAPSVRRSAFWQTCFGKEIHPVFSALLDSSSAVRKYTFHGNSQNLNDGLDVSGYRWVIRLNYSRFEDDPLTFHHVLPNGEELNYALYDLIDAFVRENEEATSFDEIRLELDERSTLLLTYMYVRYDGNRIDWCDLSGVMLVRE